MRAGGRSKGRRSLAGVREMKAQGIGVPRSPRSWHRPSERLSGAGGRVEGFSLAAGVA
jgi:hypothetical protein